MKKVTTITIITQPEEDDIPVHKVMQWLREIDVDYTAVAVTVGELDEYEEEEEEEDA